MKRILFLLLALVLFVLSTGALAQIPRIINYQGMLLGSDEQPVPEGDYKITFNLYDDANNLQWSEVHNQVYIGGGMLHVLLGTTNPLNLPFDIPYFLGIQVGNDPELQPRMMMTSAAYSFRAEDANAVGGFHVSDIPAPNTLLPLDNNAKFPASVLPGGGTAGDFLKKNEPDTSRGNSNDPMLLISNLGNGDGVNGRSVNGRGIEGRSDNHNGIVGWTGAADKSGVFGFTTNGIGVTGRSDTNDGTVGWTGASDKSGVFGFSTNGLGVTGRSTNNYGVLARSENSHSLYIPSSGAAGVYVKDAGSHGFDVAHAAGSGVQVYSADGVGVRVVSAGNDGLRIDSANWSGVWVGSSGADAIRVQSAGQDGLRIFDTVGRDYIRAGSDANPEFIFNKGGDAYADSGWFGPADFAELIEVDGSVTSYEPGDVLVISEDKDRAVTISSQPYSTAIVGVYSTKPGFVGSVHPMKGKHDNEIPVAITGIAPCKVSAENGAIHRGDLLTTSSTPGYAMKATAPKIGTILGKAMQSLESGSGKIEVLIILH